MSYTTTTHLGLSKAVVGSNQAFETSVFNANLDLLDADSAAQAALLASQGGDIASLGSQLSAAQADIVDLETLTTSGTVNAATSATTAATASNALKLDGRKLNVGSSTPVSPTVGDLWIQV